MRNGFVGEFAVAKIDAVFDYIGNEKKKKMEQGSEYKLDKNKTYETNTKIISNIDEPLIRVKLEQGMIELEEHETELQKEIAKLEAQQRLITERLTKLREDDKNSK